MKNAVIHAFPLQISSHFFLFFICFGSCISITLSRGIDDVDLSNVSSWNYLLLWKFFREKMLGFSNSDPKNEIQLRKFDKRLKTPNTVFSSSKSLQIENFQKNYKNISNMNEILRFDSI